MMIWFLARGAGISAFAALSVATGVGAMTARRTGNLERRVLLQYLHRTAALSGVLLLAIHIGSLLLDSYAHVGVLGATIPLASGYRPAAVTLGVIAMYLLVAVAVTGMLRSRFARSERAVRLWRGIHVCSYGAWALAAWHFLVVGTDSGRWWARAVLFGGVAIVGCGVTARLADRRLVTSRRVAPLGTTGAV
jgi:hypothetical protein